MGRESGSVMGRFAWLICDVSVAPSISGCCRFVVISVVYPRASGGMPRFLARRPSWPVQCQPS
jgi:hypothetical protein